MTRVWTAMLAAGCLVLCCTDGSARQRMSFAPGDRSRLFVASPGKFQSGATRTARSTLRKTRMARRSVRAIDGTGPGAPPGSGFTMQDGVLTYPAPARFQPKNLKR